MNPYRKFVNDFVTQLDEAKVARKGGFPPCEAVDLPADARTILLFSPHPDDESIVGGLALRLLREAKMRVVNVAVTQGSSKQRQGPRFQELQGACEHLGFDLIQVQEGGLENINRKGRETLPDNWAAAVRKIATILSDQKPDIVFIPHDGDWNSSHIGTHLLVVDAMQTLGDSFGCYVVENEFWAPMNDPNLMVEMCAADLADLITALSFHVGEVERNPYHLGLPSWMRDNVRRGGELVGEQGGAVPDFPFATLYRLRKWQQGRMIKTFDGGKIVGAGDDIAALFE